MFSDNPTLSRIMAITLLVGVIAGVWSGLVAPIVDHQLSQKIEIERAFEFIKEFESRREDIGSLKRELASFRNDRKSAGAYFTARNSTLAAAKLQSLIKSLTEAAGARLTSTQVLISADEKKASERITVKASMVGSIEAVRSIFHTLEARKPLVFLDDISITASPLRRRTRQSSKANNRAGLLTVHFSAYGFLWHGSKT